MITNKELRDAFKSIVDAPDLLTGISRLSSRSNNRYWMDSRINKQIHRGQAARFWEGAPKGGCTQCAALFSDFDAINKFCFDCYKILIEPRNIAELFKLLLVFERIPFARNNSRKCMIDERPYSKSSYKGFVYCRGIDEANELLDTVKHAVSENISSDIPVTIKRGCTEYGIKYPEYADLKSTKQFNYRKEWELYEEFVDKYYVFEGNVDCLDENGLGTDPLRELPAFQFWLRYAATKGDRSYMILTGGKKIPSGY